MTEYYCETCETTTDHDTLGDYRECIECGTQHATCEACDRARTDAEVVEVARATMSSPAEYAMLCRDCRPRVRLTGVARRQAMADAGIDTHRDYASAHPDRGETPLRERLAMARNRTV